MGFSEIIVIASCIQVAGHLFVVYNMGSRAHLISDLQHRLNDGKYHVVRFERNGAKAALHIDNYPKIFKEPPGGTSLQNIH